MKYDIIGEKGVSLLKKVFQYFKGRYELYSIVYSFLIVFCVITFAMVLLDIGYSGVATEGEEVIETMGSLSSSSVEPDRFLKEYADIIVTVITAIIVALVSITVTIFVFLKSALDRLIDENRYIADIANIYKSDSSSLLARLCACGFGTLLLSIVWHFFLTFKECHCDRFLLVGMTALALALLCNLALSSLFWEKCIRVENSLQAIIGNECQRLKGELTREPFMAPNSDCFKLIGDWDQWDTEDMCDVAIREHGCKLCQEMTSDQFINLFLRTELLLLAGERGLNSRDPQDSDILTVLQERSNILNPNSRVGNQDLEGRHYLGESSTDPEVVHYMNAFEDRIGYNAKEDAFFSGTKMLYSTLQQYRNLLISWKFTLTKGGSSKNASKRLANHPIEDDTTRAIFAQGLYYFFLRILAVFVSALHISDFSFNGFTLNFANFYSSTLEGVSLYSSEFYHTIFARTQLIRVVMDVSRFDSIDFYNTKFSDSTLNNVEFSLVCFEGVQMERGGLSACVFIKCQLHNSNFTDCVLNNSEFIDCDFASVDFLHAKMRGITWKGGTKLNGCSFQYAEIQGWTWQDKAHAEMRDCDFSNSTWSDMRIKGGELTGSDFSNAVLPEISFKDTDLESTLFQQCGLALAEFDHCSMNQVSLEKALLFEARFRSTDLRMANLFQVAAVKIHFIECDLTDSNCADADFSEGTFDNAKLCAARLYDCSLVKSKFTGCNCNYLLADHMQFTFARCTKSRFCHGSLSESNLTGSSFTACRFDGSDLTNLNATEVTFQDCRLVGIDFSGTRFMKARFLFSQPAVARRCNFSNCKFEQVVFRNVMFRNCVFSGAVFIDCFIEDPNTANHSHLDASIFQDICRDDTSNVSFI